MINIISVLTFIKQQLIVQWLQGHPSIPEKLSADPVWLNINQVYIADSEGSILEMLSMYVPDVLFMEATLLTNPKVLISKILHGHKDTRIVIIITEKSLEDPNMQNLLDFCIDNGVYDIVTKPNNNSIKTVLFDGAVRKDVEHLRSSSDQKVSAQSVITEEESRRTTIDVPKKFGFKPQLPKWGKKTAAEDTNNTENSDFVTPISDDSPLQTSIEKKQIIATFSMKSVGKTSVTVNIAIALQKRGLNVVIIDINNITPDVGAYMGIKRGTPGIERYFTGATPIDELSTLIHKTHGIDVIPMGSVGEMSAVPMQSHQIHELVGELRGRLSYDIILFDLSPDLNNPSNRMVIAECDLAILVVNQLPATVENMYNQIVKMNKFCNKQNSSIRLVVNNYRDDSINVKKIKAFLNVDILGKIPYDYNGFDQSVKTRTPYVIKFPKKIAPFNEMASQILGFTPETKNNGLLDMLKSKLLGKGN